jgi:hypothetical protein
MQIKKECVMNIDRKFFGYLWVSYGSESEKGINRIKKSVKRVGTCINLSRP